MKVSLCNEVLREMEFAEQCLYTAALGYDGIEIAPFTLSSTPHELSAHKRSELARSADEAGLQITGLHWLLITPEGLSVTSPDDSVRKQTLEVMNGLVQLCADLGGQVLIHGSPKQRLIGDEEDRASAESRAEEMFAAVAETAGKFGVTYCIEPLTTAETNYINSIEEAATLVRKIGNPHFKTMLDTKAVRSGETQSVTELLRRWVPENMIGHVHVNDKNLRGPGQGEDEFATVFATLRELGYEGVVAVEPFDYHPDGLAASARAIGYIRGILEALDLKCP